MGSARSKIIGVIAFVLIGITLFNPINSRITRLLMILALLALWVGVVWICKSKRAKWIAGLLPLLLLFPFLLPGRTVDVAKLRADYLANLRSTTGAVYLWGAESGRAIDCSGLPRLALRRAYLRQGIDTMNGSALRTFLYQWWNDASAKALGDGYLGYTVPLKTKGQIKDMSYDELQPGDLAVTSSGAHILVLLGGEEWIQADPGVGHVAIFNGRSDENTWFRTPVTTHRWSVFK
ncbi:MAG: NlpC/P60 family protein [Fimbriimonadaceae bacterium]